MKKVIKILPLLFLLSGLSNLAHSQNVKTLATNCCCEADKVNIDKIENKRKIVDKIRQKLLKENEGVLLEVDTNIKDCPDLLADHFQLAHISISEDLLSTVKNRLNLLGGNSKNKEVLVEIVNKNNEKYIDNDALFDYETLENDSEYINHFTYFIALSDAYNNGVIFPEKEKVDKGFNFEVGETYTIKISVDGEEIFNQEVEAIEAINSSNVKRLNNKAKKQNAKVNKAKKNRKSNMQTCVPVKATKKEPDEFTKLLAQKYSEILKENDGIMLGISSKKETDFKIAHIIFDGSCEDDDELIIEITDENGNKYINKKWDLASYYNHLGNYCLGTIAMNFYNHSKIMNSKIEEVNDEFDLEIGKVYTVKIIKNDETVVNKKVKAFDAKKIDNVRNVLETQLKNRKNKKNDDDENLNQQNRNTFLTVTNFDDPKFVAKVETIAKHRSQVLKQHNGIMLGVKSDKESNVASLYIDKSNIDLNNIKESNELFDSSEELVLKIISEDNKEYIDRQYRPLFVAPGNFYYGFTMPLCSEAESADEDFKFEVGKVYTIKLEKNSQTIMEEQVTAMDIYILNKKMCF